MAPQKSNISAVEVMAIATEVYMLRHKSAPPRNAATRARLATEQKNASQLHRIAEKQRRNSIRAFYKGRAGFIDILAPERDATEGADSSAFLSFMEALRRATVPNQLAAVTISRETHVLLRGDLAFAVAGTVQKKDAQGNMITVESDELWWAINVTRPHSRDRVTDGCVVHAFYLDRLSGNRWKLLNSNEEDFYYGSLIREPSGQPIVVPSDDLPLGWDTSNNLVYSFPNELVERLDEAAEAALQPDEQRSLSPTRRDSESEGDEIDDADAGPGVQAGNNDVEAAPTDPRAVRAASRAQERERRNGMRQSTLQDCLQRPAREPPPTRPRRTAAGRPRSGANRPDPA